MFASPPLFRSVGWDKRLALPRASRRNYRTCLSTDNHGGLSRSTLQKAPPVACQSPAMMAQGTVRTRRFAAMRVGWRPVGGGKAASIFERAEARRVCSLVSCHGAWLVRSTPLACHSPVCDRLRAASRCPADRVDCAAVRGRLKGSGRGNVPQVFDRASGGSLKGTGGRKTNGSSLKLSCSLVQILIRYKLQ
jgi:hypothetical protein